MNKVTSIKLARRLILVSVLCFGMLACTSSQTSRQISYYLFDANPSQLQVSAENEATKDKVISTELENTHTQTSLTYLARPQIKISQVRLPLYLNTSNLITVADDLSVRTAKFHKWADSLDRSIQRALINDLNALQNQFLFVEKCLECVEFEVHIAHFYPTTQGNVILVGVLEHTDEQTTLKSPFYFTKDLSQDGYTHSVNQMRLQIKELAVLINSSLDY